MTKKEEPWNNCYFCSFSRIKGVESKASLPKKMFMICVKHKGKVEHDGHCSAFSVRFAYADPPVHKIIDPCCFPEEYGEHGE